MVSDKCGWGMNMMYCCTASVPRWMELLTEHGPGSRVLDSLEGEAAEARDPCGRECKCNNMDNTEGDKDQRLIHPGSSAPAETKCSFQLPL